MDFNLSNWLGGDEDDNIGWRVLEIAYFLLEGTLLWIDAVEWLFLSAMLTLLYISVRSHQERLLGIRWARLGLVMAFLCFVDFASDILRFQSWRTFSMVALGITVISRLILLPIWLVWLGRQLYSIHKTGGGAISGTVMGQSHQQKSLTLGGGGGSGGVQELTNYGSNADDTESTSAMGMS